MSKIEVETAKIPAIPINKEDEKLVEDFVKKNTKKKGKRKLMKEPKNNPERVEKIAEILYNEDYVGLKKHNCPKNEYLREAKLIERILDKCRSIGRLHAVVFVTFLESFNCTFHAKTDDFVYYEIIKPSSSCLFLPAAKMIWELREEENG